MDFNEETHIYIH